MTCNDCQIQLVERMAGELGAEARQALDAHLAACAGCAQRARDWNAIQAAARVPAARVDDAFWIQQRHQIMEKIAAPPAFGWRPRLAGSLVLASLAVGVFWLRPSGRNDMAVAQQAGFLQDMELLKDLDVLETWDGATRS